MWSSHNVDVLHGNEQFLAQQRAKQCPTMPRQATYTPTAMDYDFALITLSQPASSSAGFLGMTVGTGSVTLNLTSAGYPVRAKPSTSSDIRVDF